MCRATNGKVAGESSYQSTGLSALSSAGDKRNGTIGRSKNLWVFYTPGSRIHILTAAVIVGMEKKKSWWANEHPGLTGERRALIFALHSRKFFRIQPKRGIDF
jgi:hypothetical protein